MRVSMLRISGLLDHVNGNVCDLDFKFIWRRVICVSDDLCDENCVMTCVAICVDDLCDDLE